VTLFGIYVVYDTIKKIRETINDIFENFAEVCNKIKGISGSLDMTTVVASFLNEVDDNELEIATRFYYGKCVPCLE